MKKKIANNKSLIITLMFLFAGLMPVCGAEIHDAVIDGNLAEVKSLLAENPQLVNARDDQNSSSTPLHKAAANNHKDIVELLIATGAQVNAKDKLGSTALHWAAYNGHKDIVDLLIAGGAQVSAKTTKRNQTPLCWATCRGHKEIVELLIAKGAEVNTKDRWEQTPLHRAAEKNRKDVLEVLIANRARLNAKDRWGNTALHVAAYYGHKDIVEVLIADGADVNDKSKTGWTPLRMALHMKHQEIAELLRKHVDKEGYEPSPTLVGELGEPARLSFEGIKTFTPKKIRNGLMVNPDFLLASHPAAPFSKYLEAVQKKVRAGYQHNGFPEVQVTTRFDKSTGKIAVKVVEGPRYICGDVRVTGLKTLSTEPFIRRLTRPWPPPESADILPKSPEDRGKCDSLPSSFFRCVDSIGKEVEPKPPIWQKNKPASFSDYSLKLLNEQVKAVLSEFGYFFPALEVKVVPEPNNATAQLLVQILDEGPKGTIGVIEVTKSGKNTPEEILKYLELEVGMEITRSLVTKTEYLLWRSARFLDYKVTPALIDPREPKLKLNIDLTEYEPAPPLFKDKDFSPAGKTLLKLADFLSDWPAGQDDVVISGHSKVYGTDVLQVVISPQKGMLFMVKETDPAFRGTVRAAAVFSPDKFALFSPRRQRKLVFPGTPGHMIVRLSILRNPDPKDKKLFAYDVGFGIGYEKHEQPWRVYARIAPVASVYEAHTSDITYSSDKEILEINGKGYQLKVDSESGKPIELVLSKYEKKGKFRLTTKKGAFDQVMNQIEKATAQCRNEFKPQEPFSSTLAYLAEEKVLQKLFVQSSLSRKVTPEQLASATTVLARILEKRPLAPLEGLILKGPAESGEDFTLPQDSPQTSGTPLQKLLTKFSAVIFKWCNDLFPQRSWPRTIAREAVFVFGGMGRYTTTELQRIYESKETGPIGCLATGNLLNIIKWPQWPHARAFADRGLERLSADDFRNDWRLLLKGESVLAQCLVRTAEAFRDLDDEDIEALVLLLPPERATFVRNSVRLLREEKGKPVGEVLRPALDEYWEKVLKKRVEAALRKLAIKASRRRPPIQAANRDYKKLISNLACVTLKVNDADVLATDNDGQTPLHTVSGVGRENVTDLLRRHGCVK